MATWNLLDTPRLGAAVAVLLLTALAARGDEGDAAPASVPEPDPPNSIRHVHDPEIIGEGEWTYVFSTGPGVMIRRSRDMVHWEFVGHVFKDEVPAWAKKEIPGATALWAPGIARFNGLYHLYYSVSTFGSNRSMIGLAVNKTLDPKSMDYRWEDRGKVLESNRSDHYNAIDPAIVAADKGRVYMSFGSFWSGLKIVEIDPETGKPPSGAEVRPIAQRPMPGAIEAPYIVKHGRFYYLFASFDLCCRGKDSTYNIRVGRATDPEGPYVDRDGKPMRDGGGTLLLAGDDRHAGPGHCSVLSARNGTWLAYHVYDVAENGIPTLMVRPMRFGRDGWPVLGAPLGEAKLEG